jgi:hypothetical protein
MKKDEAKVSYAERTKSANDRYPKKKRRQTMGLCSARRYRVHAVTFFPVVFSV